jgi:hypothetical protein
VVAALHGVSMPLTMEIRASSSAVEAGLNRPGQLAEEIERAIRGAAPDWEITQRRAPAAPRGRLRYVASLERPGVPPWAPLCDVGDCGDADLLGAVLEAAQPLADDEEMLVRYLVRPARNGLRAKAQHGLTQPLPLSHPIDLITALFDASPRVPRFESRLQRALEERLAQPAFELIGAVALAGNEPARLESRARSLASVFGSRFDVGFGGLQLNSWSDRAGPDTLPADWRKASEGLYVTAGELAALWHAPSSRVLVPGVAYVTRPSQPIPLQLTKRRGLLLGTHRQRGMDVPVHLPTDDLRAGHAVILGKTGVGKSTIEHQMLRQLIADPQKPSVVLIDPHGDQALDIARLSIPPHRRGEVVLLELGDTENPVGLSLFQRPPNVSEDDFIQATFAVLRLVFRENWSPTRMEDCVFALTATLCRLPNSTLLDAPRLFGDAVFRRRALAQLDDPAVLEFWGDFEQLSEAARREVVRPVLYRLRSFYRAKPVRNMICQNTAPDLEAILDNGGILLVSLAGRSIQAEADLLGELLISRLHLTLLARLERRQEKRRPTYLAADEAQHMKGASLPVLLSEGRKLGAGLILSTQYLEAWGETLSESVLGNVGALIVFRCGPTDSRRLAASLKPFTPDQLENLDRYEAIVKLQSNGSTMPAFDLKTLPVENRADEGVLACLRRETRQRYARPRRKVETEISTKRSATVSGWETVDVDEE